MSDVEILAGMAVQPAIVWQELFAAADELDSGAGKVDWTALQQLPDGSMVLPYPIYGETVRRIERLLYDLRVIVPRFNWMAWDPSRYVGGAGLADAPAADAARVATRIFRSERFGDGSIAAALEDGTLRAVLARLRRWFEDEDPATERKRGARLSADERALLIRIARCPLIEAALAQPSHRCRRVVAAQAEPFRQVPEGWAGNLRDARVVFLSSNPSLSLASPGQPADAVEPYPVAESDDDYIADFLGRRFDPTVKPAPYVKDSRSLLCNGTYAVPTRFWTEIQRRAEELLDDADPARNYVMTEVVHCKSRKNVGASHAAGTCADRYLRDVLALTAAPIVVVMGKIAHSTIRAWHPELPKPPDIYPWAELGGRNRVFLFTGQPGSNKPRVIASNGLYGAKIRELRAIAASG